MKGNSKLLMVMLAITLMTACFASPVSAKPQTENWMIGSYGDMNAGCTVNPSNLKVSGFWIDNNGGYEWVLKIYDDSGEVIYTLPSAPYSGYTEVLYEMRFEKIHQIKPVDYKSVKLPDGIATIVIELQ